MFLPSNTFFCTLFVLKGAQYALKFQEYANYSSIRFPLPTLHNIIRTLIFLRANQAFLEPGKDQTIQIISDAGIPQGSKLGPALFAV